MVNGDLKVNRRMYAAGARWGGRRHNQESQECQDDVATYYSRRLAIVVLCDGAGSAKYSSRGANLGSKEACKTLRGKFHVMKRLNLSKIGEIVYEAVYSNIQREAMQNKASLGDYACTLLFAATDGKDILLGQLGDGIIAINKASHGVWKRVFDLPVREYINQTPLISDKKSIKYLQIRRIKADGVSNVALMSDGAAESLYQRRSDVLAPALGRMAGWLEKFPIKRVNFALRRALADQISKRTLDDVSIAILSTGK